MVQAHLVKKNLDKHNTLQQDILGSHTGKKMTVQETYND